MLIEEGYDNSKIAFFMLFWACMDRFWAKLEYGMPNLYFGDHLDP